MPLDYSKPSGETIELRARKVPAKDRTGKVGTLFINPGGPGGSGLEFAAAASFVLGSPLLRKFDVIGWDPRGVGESTPVKCLDTEQLDKVIATDGSPDNEAEIKELETQSKILADGCEQRSGNLLPHVSTKDAARDIDVLRGIVGDSELYYLGMSYGTFLGATYAELFPKNVGRLVLDGAVDPSKTAEENGIAQAKGFDTALDAFAEDCAQNDCRLGSTKEEVLAAVDKILTETDAKPLPGSGGRDVPQALAVLGVIYPLYNKSLWPRLEDAVVSALTGNGAKLLALADRVHQPGGARLLRQRQRSDLRGQLHRPSGPHLDRSGQGGGGEVQGGVTAVRLVPALGLADLRELAGQAGGQAARDQGGRSQADRGGRAPPATLRRRTRGPSGWQVSWRAAC